MIAYKNKPIATLDSLAKALNLELDELNKIYMNSNDYYYISRRVKKDDGSFRVTYDVRPKLKDIHTKIKKLFFNKVDYPPYILGGVKNCDYIKNASIHAGRKLIITEDISNFFPNIKKEYVKKMWMYGFGFSIEVSEFLAEITTYDGFVPQGGVNSGYIANLVFFDKEPSLYISLEKMGVKYSRFVDDITLSCNYPLSKKTLSSIISKVYGMLFSIDVQPNRKKHKIMLRCFSQKIHKLNVNSGKPSLTKKNRMKIKAAVFECELTAKKDRVSKEYKTLFNSTVGRVNTLGRMHPAEAKKLKNRLSIIKPVSLEVNFEKVTTHLH